MEHSPFKVRDKRNRGWFYLDNEYLNGYAKIFGPIGTGIYLSLCRHVDSSQKCFPSEKTMADELNIAERTVRKYLKQLEAWNLIVIGKARSEQGKFLHNEYWLVDKSEWKKKPSANGADGTQDAEPSASDDPNQRHTVPHKDTNKKNTNNKETHPSNASVAMEGLNEIISLFKVLNPSYERLFSNKTERAAAERLAGKMGREDLETVIGFAARANSLPYAPTITTPYELEKNLGRLHAFYNKEKAKQENKGLKIAFYE
jgi:Helix-turn-helix domain